MKIYVAHQISGLSYEEVVLFYESARKRLEEYGYDVLHPMTGKSALRTEVEFRSKGYDNPISSNHAIYSRDQWMVRKSDIVLAIMDGMEKASVGISMELAWAQILGKHVVISVTPNTPMDHIFVLESASIVFHNEEDAFQYLETLIEGKI